MPYATLGDVTLNVQPGAVRRVRTTTRLKRLPFGRLLVVLATSVLDRSDGLSVEFSPSILLQPWPASDLDKDPPNFDDIEPNISPD
jgi:hypothetical protein